MTIHFEKHKEIFLKEINPNCSHQLNHLLHFAHPEQEIQTI